LSELEPTATAFYRVALAAPAFLVFSFARREAPSLTAYSKAQWLVLFWLIAAGGFFALDLFCLHWSLRRTSVVNATLFLNFAPIFVSLRAWVIFGELPTRRAVLSYVIAIGGVGLLLWRRCDFRAREAFWRRPGSRRRRGLWRLSAGGQPLPPQDADEPGHGRDHAILRLLSASGNAGYGREFGAQNGYRLGHAARARAPHPCGRAGSPGICDEIFSGLHLLGHLAAAAGGRGMRRLDPVQRDPRALADAGRRGCVVWNSALRVERRTATRVSGD